MESGKITPVQMAMLLYAVITPTAVLLVPGAIARHAKQDMWLSPFWASLIGFLTVYIVVQLHRLYPNKTLIQYSTDIAGTFVGKMVGLIFILSHLHGAGLVIRAYAEFIVGHFLHHTPLSFVMGTMGVVCAVAVRSGIDVLGRLAQILVPVVMIWFVIIVLLLLPDMDLRNMLPVLEDGIWPSVKGSIILQGWFSQCVFMSFFLPYMTNRDHGQKWGNIAVIATMMTLWATLLMTLFVLGNIAEDFLYPVMDAVRYTSIADFLEHVEVIVMAFWVVGAFLKIAVFFYAVVVSLAQWIGMSEYKPLVFPVGFMLFFVSIWAARDVVELGRFVGTVNAFYILFTETIIPLLLLLIAKRQKQAAFSGQNGK
ncbi:GerAB/ArcD/ProY family transporter [Geobacillus subterraneus]|uniref:GerAB/ArcD/ProY family transporter n=1 Tax=Geobacillus subterraneus TaxID=129338 RepID=UPI001620FE03